MNPKRYVVKGNHQTRQWQTMLGIGIIGHDGRGWDFDKINLIFNPADVEEIAKIRSNMHMLSF